MRGIGRRESCDLKQVFEDSTSVHPSLYLTSYPQPPPFPDGEWREVEMYPRPDSTVYLYGNPRYEEEEALDPTYSFRPPSNPADISAIGNKFISSTTISDMVDLAKTVAPCLLYERVLATQACYLPSSPDRAPVIGKMPGLSNLFMATGHSCWGILLAPGTGLAIAEMIADHISATHSTVCDMSPFLPSRFRVRKRRKRAIGGTSLSPSSRRRVDKTALSKTRITSTITDSIGSSTSGAGSEGDGDDVIQEDSAAASGGDVQSYAYWLTSQGGCGNRTGGVASAAVGEKRKLLELESDKDMINNSDHNNSSSSISNDTKRPRYNSVVVGQMYDENGRLKPISLLAAGSSISSSTTHK